MGSTKSSETLPLRMIVLGVAVAACVAYFGAHRLHLSSTAKVSTGPRADATTGADLVELMPADPTSVSNKLKGPTILSESFGWGRNLTDVIARVTELLQSTKNGFTIDVRALKADPLRGKVKRLTVKYDYLGTNHTMGIPENGRLTVGATWSNTR